MSSIADILTPAWDLLLIRRDPPSKVIGIGLGGGDIISPDTSRDTGRAHTGVILKVGPQAHEVFAPGVRVVFGPFSATVLGTITGDDRDICILPPGEVICLVTGKYDEKEQLSAGWVEHAQAVPGHLLVERAEKPLVRGRIIIPDGTNAATRSAEVEVVSVGQDVQGCFKVGDGALLGGGVGRSVSFGLRDERRFYKATPRQVLGLLDEPLAQVTVPEESQFRHASDIMQPEEVVLDEGDPRAPR